MDGKLLATGVDALELDADRFMNLMSHLLIEDNMGFEKEVLQKRDEARRQIMFVYNKNYENDLLYGSSNDSAYTGEPLPYIEPTVETEDGFPGLDAPLN